MILNVVILVVGFIALIKGADIFVEGSSNAAKNLKISSLLIGLTIVAFGTSAPELAVSVSAAMQGLNEISISNVVGSNIFNLMFILGVCALIKPLAVDEKILRRDMPISIIATALTLVLCFNYSLIGNLTGLNISDNAGRIYTWLGVALLIGFVFYLYLLIKDSKNNPQPEETYTAAPMSKCIVFIIVGLIMVIIGGKAVVYGAKELARLAGMTETLIGLTIVAIGTSLPELVTSVVATRKGEIGLAIGNVVGSNIFNLLFILGVSGCIYPIGVNFATIIDLLILVAFTVLGLIFMKTSKSLSKKEGFAMVVIYIIYLVYAVIR